MAVTIARISVTPSQLQELKEFAIKHTGSWPSPGLTVNPQRQIWPKVTNGFTPEAHRMHIQGLSPLLDAIAEELLARRYLGGRFFLDHRGAFIRPEGEDEQFVAFDIRN